MYTIEDVPMDNLDPEEILICPDVQEKNLRALASAVIFQAIRDMTRKREVRRAKDAFLWVTGPELEAWQDIAGVLFDPYTYILPRLREVKRKLERR